MKPARRKASLSNVKSPDSKFRERWLKQAEHESDESSDLKSRNLDYTHEGNQPQQTSRLVRSSSLSTIRPLNFTKHEENRVRRKSASATVRSLDFTRGPEISEQPSRERRSSTSSNIRLLDYTHARKQSQLGRRKSSLSGARQLDYICASEASSQLRRERRKSSFSALQLHSSAGRTLNYTHAKTSEPSPHLSRDSQLHSSAAWRLDYTHVETSKPSPNLSEDSQVDSSAARMLDYTKFSDNDQARRGRSLSKALSLDYTRRGKTSDTVSKPSLLKARSLDYTRTAIDYTATSPQMRGKSSASKVRALDYIHDGGNGEESWIDNVRDQSAFSNIRLASDDEDNTGYGQN